MANSSPPLPIRHSSTTPRAPFISRFPDSIDDVDELAADTIPCSPSTFLRDPPRERDTTQPTQILSKPGLTLDTRRSSSPASVVEVPASSPFQPKQPSRLGSRLAPAGTFFRPPPRQPPSRPSQGPKRPAAEPISLISEDEGDSSPPRGDIRPTTFMAKIAEFAYNPAAEERELKAKMRQIYDVFGNMYPSEKVREALKACKNDLDDAVIWLESRPKQTRKSNSQQPSKTTRRRLVSKAAIRSNARNPISLDRDTSPSLPSSPPKKQEKPQRRRLVQGLKRRNDSSPRKSFDPSPPTRKKPLVIDLVDNDKEDAYEAEPSPAPSEENDDRVLHCLNTSTLKELAAMTGMKEALLEPLIEKRPFDHLSQARRVSATKKAGARKSPRVSTGESAVGAVEVFLNAVTAIDHVVAKCEIKGQAVKSVMDRWDLDTFGHDKRGSRASPFVDMPPTPSSMNSKYTRPLIPRQPKMMDGHCQMKPFQLFGLNWMSLLCSYDIGCILADEMGLGKTCQVISFMCHLVEEYEREPKATRPWPNLIVVPPSTYNNWLHEFERFAPDLSIVGYRGSQAERAEIAHEVERHPESYHVVLATYSQINSEADIEAMQSFDLNAAVFDEGHKMKNQETKSYRDLRRIPAKWKMLLTGTPVQNNLLEMTALLNFINPKMFDGYMDDIQYIFSQKVTIRDVSNGAFLYAERVKRARTILEPFILQRRKDQVLSDMPAKTCTVVHCDMTDSQKKTYGEYEALFKLEPSSRAAKAKGRQNDQNNVWMQLRKAALHPLLFRRHFTDEMVAEMGRILMDRIPQSELHQPDMKHLVQELKNSSDFELHLWCRDYPGLLKQFDIPSAAELDSGKVKKLLELIRHYQEKGDRVLVFSKFSRLIELLREVLALQGIEHRVLMGNTDVSERQTLIDEFNEDAKIPVFLLTTGAGGTGINLTAANKVIIFDQSDNPQDDIQAENRAHRLGQRRDVEVVRLIASQTIEELIYRACQKKIELANKVTGALEDADGAEGNVEQEVRKMMMTQGEMTPPQEADVAGAPPDGLGRGGGGN
ncbi:SNF2-related protein [Metarhizium album ARSEF 1941]|uniref:SNF2-related protein n=1 Tax=Metarhizium album (strain ARSEF 1941) TaxID=1081103 RepID=A0A0B2WWQ0_METAS|nr:SNF2-related protein [Metarhizium album ARSEF 1941]KHN98493.1 SNF2-related protein [Metarhizium album ARSEF 1941]